MLVLLEEGSMSVCEVCKGPAEVPCLLDWALIFIRSEPMILKSKDCEGFEELVSHHELFARSRNKSIVLFNSHSRVSG